MPPDMRRGFTDCAGRATRGCLALTVLLAAVPAFAQEAQTRSWREEKCVRYQRAWDELAARRGTRGLGPEFIERHAAFIAGGCTGQADVCPRSAEELEVANIMIVAAMNAGTASTFPPFACRK